MKGGCSVSVRMEGETCSYQECRVNSIKRAVPTQAVSSEGIRAGGQSVTANSQRPEG